MLNVNNDTIRRSSKMNGNQIAIYLIIAWFSLICLFVPLSTLREGPPLILIGIVLAHGGNAIGLLLKRSWSRWGSLTLLCGHFGILFWLTITLLRSGVRGFPFGQIGIFLCVVILMGAWFLISHNVSTLFGKAKESEHA